MENRFRTIFPDAIPWRERARQNALATALEAHGATDAERYDKLAREHQRLMEATALPMRVMLADDAKPFLSFRMAGSGE